ncbi:MAG: ATP-binding cassette domain-containing protein [Promethearchaeota archaeon]
MKKNRLSKVAKVEVNFSGPVVSVRDFSFKYKRSGPLILDNISIDIYKGDSILIIGASGSGKSTFNYAISSLIPWSIHGYFKGDILLFGKSILNIKPSKIAGRMGLLMQNPEMQFVNINVLDELLFAVENLNIERSIIKRRLDKITQLLNLKPYLDRNITQLSSGEKQRVVLGSILMMQPEVLILDEPFAFLDQKGRAELINYLVHVKNLFKKNLTLIISEHRFDDLIYSGLTSRIMTIENKKLIEYDNINEINWNSVYNSNSNSNSNYNSKEVPSQNQQLHFFKKITNTKSPILFEKAISSIYSDLKKNIFKYFVIANEDNVDFDPSKKKLINTQRNEIVNTKNFPSLLHKKQIFKNLKFNYDQFIRDYGFRLIASEKNNNLDKDNNKYQKKEVSGENTHHDLQELIKVERLSFEYQQTFNKNRYVTKKIFSNLSFSIEENDILAIVGKNGIGKTTLLFLLAGIYQPSEGTIFYRGKPLSTIPYSQYAKKIGIIFQNPETQILKNTIYKELAFAPRNFGIMSETLGSLPKIKNLLDLIFASQYNMMKMSFSQINTSSNPLPPAPTPDPVPDTTNNPINDDTKPYNKEEDAFIQYLLKINPFNMSWGQKRRLNIASLYTYHPEIYLLDEPFTGQDFFIRRQIIEDLINLTNNNHTIIITSHDLDILEFCNKVLLLEEDGRTKFYVKSKNS